MLWVIKVFQKPVHLADTWQIKARSNSKFTAYFYDLIKVGIAHVEDILISADSHNIPARLYHPKPDNKSAVILYFHGGGFALGGIEAYDHFCRRMSKTSGCAVLSIDYRLTPEYKFPAAHDDVLESLNWMMTNGHAFNLDKDSLYVAGDSAGGNLAAHLTIEAREAGINLKGQILIYPVLDGKKRQRIYYDQFLLGKADSEWFIKNLINGPEDLTSKRFSVIDNDLTGLCKTLVIKAEYDHLNNEIDDYSEKLEKNNVSIQVIRVPETFHGFITMTNWTAASNQCLLHIDQFINQQ